MNLFLLDEDLEVCAASHVNKHMKIIVECCQILATAYPPGVARMKHTHKNHPCSVWIRKSLSNFNFAIKYGGALCRENFFRYGRHHKCEADLNWYRENQPDIPDIGMTEFPRAFGDFKDSIPKHLTIHEAYREYYKTKSHLFFNKDGSHCWKGREMPVWVKEFLASKSV